MDPWCLPQSLRFGGEDWKIRPDFRIILRIFRVLRRGQWPLGIRWLGALRLFYEAPVPGELTGEAVRALCRFINGGQEPGRPGPVLFDWDADADLIAADMNHVAGLEIRQQPFVHWWTFLAWFRAMGEGQFATLVRIRAKRLRGQSLEDWERQLCREEPERTRPPRDPGDAAQKQAILKMLDGEDTNGTG